MKRVQNSCLLRMKYGFIGIMVTHRKKKNAILIFVKQRKEILGCSPIRAIDFKNEYLKRRKS